MQELRYCATRTCRNEYKVEQKMNFNGIIFTAPLCGDCSRKFRDEISVMRLCKKEKP